MDILRSQLARSNALARAALVAAMAMGGTACGRDAGRGAPAVREAAAATTVARGEGGAPVSLDSALALFRIGLVPVERLGGGAESIDRLVERFVASIARSDTSALREMVMTRREFAWLYYPDSPFTRAPTRQEPGLAWFLHLQGSQKGVTRLLTRYGGTTLPVVGNSCSSPIRMSANTLWSDCVQRLIQGSDTVPMRLFAGILERDGHFKIFSYSNDL